MPMTILCSRKTRSRVVSACRTPVAASSAAQVAAAVVIAAKKLDIILIAFSFISAPER
jgi:hypothetical protein